jgi:hypothetical protein
MRKLGVVWNVDNFFGKLVAAVWVLSRFGAQNSPKNYALQHLFCQRVPVLDEIICVHDINRKIGGQTRSARSCPNIQQTDGAAAFWALVGILYFCGSFSR